MDYFKGLDSKEVEKSREEFGSNTLTPPKRERWYHLLLEKFKDPIIKLLIVAAILSLITGYFNGSMIESIGIVIAILLATFIAFINEYRAGKEFDILNKVNDNTPVKVCREGAVETIPKSQVVKGDIVIVEQGDEVPADGTLLHSMDLKADESQLNGESKPSAKSHIKVEEYSGAYSPNMLYRGTTISQGEGVMLVTAVGDATEIGRTARQAASITGNKTPLDRELGRLGSLIGKVGIAIAVLLFISLTTRDIVLGIISLENPWLVNVDILLRFFMISVTIIVVAVPEGLPMSVTLSLAYSMRKMTAGNTLVRKMHACETMGATTVICTDKTGTLTQNKMSVAYCSSEEPEYFADAVALNSTAFAHAGNPTEMALLAYIASKGYDYRKIRESGKVLYRLLFNTQRKFMATIVAAEGNSYRLFVKGAPEVVADIALAHSGLDSAALLAQIAAYQQRGMRTLAFASAIIPSDMVQQTPDEEGFSRIIASATFRYDGFVAIEDPIRPTVPEAIQECKRAGIEVKIVTGDTSATAVEIARQAGLWRDAEDSIERNSITGKAFSELNDADAFDAARRIKVMSRARPADKMRLVQLLRSGGEVVAVTGDGTNDAPALNYADVGLSMGSGTAVAREASDIVLLDDSFSSLVSAVKWGRQIYLNIQKFILFQLTINFAALLLALLGPFVGVELPLTVTQMLWINLIMDTFAALALATEPAHKEVMDKDPRGSGAFIITPQMWRGILGWGLLFVALLLPLLLSLERIDALFAPQKGKGLTLFFSIFVFMQFWNLFNARALGTKESAFKGIGKNGPFMLIAIAIFVLQILIVQFGGEVFRTQPLSLLEWVAVVAGCSPVLWAGEIIRRIKNKR